VATQQTKFIKMPDVLERTGMSRSTLYRGVDENTFPQPVKVGRAAFWIEAEVESWLQDRIAESRVEVAK